MMMSASISKNRRKASKALNEMARQCGDNPEMADALRGVVANIGSVDHFSHELAGVIRRLASL